MNSPKRIFIKSLIELRSFLQFARIAQAPLLVATVSILALSLPPQSIEIYRVIVQDLVYKIRWQCKPVVWLSLRDTCSAVEIAREPLLTLLGVALLCICLWLTARWLVEESGLRGKPRTTRMSLLAAPLFLPGALLLGLAIGIFNAIPANKPAIEDLARRRAFGFLAEKDIEPIDITIWKNVISEFTSYAQSLGWLCIALTCIGLSLIISSIVAAKREKGSGPLHPGFLDIIRHPRSWLLPWAGVAVGVVLFWWWPAQLGRTLGTITVFCLFSTVLLFCLVQLTRLSDRLRLPIIKLALLWAVLLSLAGLNNNHDVRTTSKAVSTGSRQSPSDVSRQFVDWLGKRPGKERYRQTRSPDDKRPPFPVYVVAAEGGGIYAAYHTARTLASLQDRCPAFTEHLFAISGVSGGSVGAAVFSSLMRAPVAIDRAASTACNPDLLAKLLLKSDSKSEAVARLFDSDLLSPLLGAMLFPDFAQRFIPAAIPAFDRARALEFALEDAVSATLVDLAGRKKAGSEFWKNAANYMRMPYAGHWTSDSNAPALIFNATSVGSGERKVISPFTFGQRGGQLVPVAGGSASIDRMPLSTAAVVSARFPWVTPSARIAGVPSEPDELRLVDGGYYDNSGIATAIELTQALEKAVTDAGKADLVSVKLIVLTAKLKPKPLSRAFHEIMDPIRAFFGAWQRRARQNVEHSDEMLKRIPRTAGDIRLIHLQETLYDFPLGWRLSSGTRYLMDIADPIPGLCRREAEFEQLKPEADCVLEGIMSELR